MLQMEMTGQLHVMAALLPVLGEYGMLGGLIAYLGAVEKKLGTE